MPRSYTVQQIEDAPCIRIRGKWLGKFGLKLGSRINLIEFNDMLVLVKVPDGISEREKMMERATGLENELNELKNSLVESWDSQRRQAIKHFTEK